MGISNSPYPFLPPAPVSELRLQVTRISFLSLTLTSSLSSSLPHFHNGWNNVLWAIGKTGPYTTGWKSPNLEFFLSLMFKDNTLTKVLIGTWRQKVRFSVTNNSCEGQITWNDIWHCSNLKHRRHHHKITNRFHDILQTWSDRPIWDQFKPMEFNLFI